MEKLTREVKNKAEESPAPSQDPKSSEEYVQLIEAYNGYVEAYNQQGQEIMTLKENNMDLTEQMEGIRAAMLARESEAAELRALNHELKAAKTLVEKESLVQSAAAPEEEEGGGWGDAAEDDDVIVPDV